MNANFLLFLLIDASFLRFGYATNTKIKFIIVLQSSNATLRDNEVRMVRIIGFS